MNKKLQVSIVALIAVALLTSTLSFTPYTYGVSDYYRLAITGDVDCKSGQTKQWDLINKFGADGLAVVGDYAYMGSSGAKCVEDGIVNHGFSATKKNLAFACGNHDDCNRLRDFMGMSKTWGKITLADGKIDVFSINGNTGFASGSTQFNEIKKLIEDSTSQYKVVIIHQPFATAPSDHGPNGKFSAYHPIFVDNDVDAVLQAHNHNYQRFMIDGIPYIISGLGWHDTGSNLYQIDGNSFQGNPLLFGEDSHNGVTYLDFQIANSSFKEIRGQLVLDSTEKTVDSFTVGESPQPPQCKPDEHMENGQCVPNPPPVPEPSGNEIEATVMEVTATTFQAGTANTPDKTIDEDLNTRWSADGDPQSITYKFDKNYNISKVGIAFYKGDVRTADFEIGGQQFVSSGSTLQLQNFTFVKDTSTVTIIGHGNSDNNWNSFTEVEFYGVKSNGTIPPPPPVEEICGNGIDDDGDGFIDENCPPPPPAGNNTFTVNVGNGTALFVPNNQTAYANATIAIEDGIAILPKP